MGKKSGLSRKIWLIRANPLNPAPKAEMVMAESKAKSATRHLARALESGASLLASPDGDAPPARLVSAHFAALRLLGGDSEAAETVCEAIRARRLTPLCPAGSIAARARRDARTHSASSRHR